MDPTNFNRKLSLDSLIRSEGEIDSQTKFLENLTTRVLDTDSNVLAKTDTEEHLQLMRAFIPPMSNDVRWRQMNGAILNHFLDRGSLFTLVHSAFRPEAIFSKIATHNRKRQFIITDQDKEWANTVLRIINTNNDNKWKAIKDQNRDEWEHFIGESAKIVKDIGQGQFKSENKQRIVDPSGLIIPIILTDEKDPDEDIKEPESTTTPPLESSPTVPELFEMEPIPNLGSLDPSTGVQIIPITEGDDSDEKLSRQSQKPLPLPVKDESPMKLMREKAEELSKQLDLKITSDMINNIDIERKRLEKEGTMTNPQITLSDTEEYVKYMKELYSFGKSVNSIYMDIRDLFTDDFKVILLAKKLKLDELSMKASRIVNEVYNILAEMVQTLTNTINSAVTTYRNSTDEWTTWQERRNRDVTAFTDEMQTLLAGNVNFNDLVSVMFAFHQ